jgi:hypothetical protein
MSLWRIVTIAGHGMSGERSRVPADTLVAASPMISMPAHDSEQQHPVAVEISTLSTGCETDHLLCRV